MARMPLVARPSYRWKLRTRVLELGEQTRLMAIVNLTPDSFSGDGLLLGGLDFRSLDASIAAAVAAVDDGADIVDLGAESTRPDAKALSSMHEQERLLPVLEGLLRERPNAIVSVDTYHSGTARAAIRAGAEIINDVSGLEWDSVMAGTIAEMSCGLVMMHTRGRPSEWRMQPHLAPAEVLPLVFAGLCERLASAEAADVASERIVADPGFGFGKIDGENLYLLAGLSRLHELGRPLLVGLSRKGFLGKTVQPVQKGNPTKADGRRIATVAGNVAAILAGAHILRVHELQPAREAAAVADAILAAEDPILQQAALFDA